MTKQEGEEEMASKLEMSYSAIKQLSLEKKLCDVLIKVDGAEFHAHKIILCGCSNYFTALFTSSYCPPDKHEYSIPDISSEMMELIMEYAYTYRVHVTKENVHELLITADYLMVRNLVNECCAFLKAQLCLENCIGIWCFACVHAFEKLKQQAFRFILHNFEEMVHVSEEFLEVTVEQLGEIIENDKLNVKQENVVFETIFQWMRHAPQSRNAHMGVLLSKVRLALLTPDYFKDHVKNNPLVKDNAACKPIISRVLQSIRRLNMKKSLGSKFTRCRLPNAVLLVIGGWSHRGPTNCIEVYDTRAECWVKATCHDENPRMHHGTVYLNGFVYCIGGFDGNGYTNTVRRFDPIARTWAQVSPMHTCRCYVSVCVLEGRICALGGFDGSECLDTVERYEPETNQWSMIAPMHKKRSNAGATALNGKVYVCGGFDEDRHLFTAEYYNPQTDQWTFIPPMRRRRSGVGVVSYDGQVYAVGGFDGVIYHRNAEVYNPQTNSWRAIPSMIKSRSHFGIEVVDDLLFVAGGRNGYVSISKVECYDKKTHAWRAVKDMKVLRSGLSCCVLSGLPNMAEYTAPQDEHEQLPHTSCFNLKLTNTFSFETYK